MPSLAELLKVTPVRNSAKKGRILEIARGVEDIERFKKGQKQINVYTLLPREIGGNHLHLTEKDETGYVLLGELDVFLLSDNESYHARIQAGHQFSIPKGIAHATHNPSLFWPSVFMETATLGFSPVNPTNDLYRVQVLNPNKIDKLYAYMRKVLKI